MPRTIFSIPLLAGIYLVAIPTMILSTAVAHSFLVAVAESFRWSRNHEDMLLTDARIVQVSLRQAGSLDTCAVIRFDH